MSPNFFQTRRLSVAGCGVAVAVLGSWLAAVPAMADEVKIGGLWDVTGPVASFVPPILAASELALKHVNDQGGLWGGDTLALTLGDSKCDAKEASAAASKLVNIDGVVAITGALCSGATIAAANTVGIDNSVVMITLGTAPGLTTLEDKDLVFRTTPSDAFQGVILADVVWKRGIDKVAITHIQNDYGKGLTDAFVARYTELGGTVTGIAAHEGKKASYRSELAGLKDGGAEYLIVIAYSADSAPVILRQALEEGSFQKFIGVGSLKDDAMFASIGWENLQGTLITEPGAPPDTPLAASFTEALTAASPDSAGKPFIANAYDATFLLALALEKAGSPDRTKISAALRDIAGPEGEVIGPGDWEKAKRLIAEGKKINYEGAAGPHDFDANGDVSGVIDVLEIKDTAVTFVEKVAN